jgi:hypothetical protein
MGWSLRVVGGRDLTFYGLAFWQVSIQRLDPNREFLADGSSFSMASMASKAPMPRKTLSRLKMSLDH